jgi:hypothetical protein
VREREHMAEEGFWKMGQPELRDVFKIKLLSSD